MSPHAKGRVVLVGLALLTAWPIFHTHLVSRYGVSPWKLGGWGMYAVPPIPPSGMEVIGWGADGSRARLGAPDAALAQAGSALLESHRWLGRLAPTGAFAERVFAAHPDWVAIDVVVYQPVLQRATGLIEMTEITHSHRRAR